MSMARAGDFATQLQRVLVPWRASAAKRTGAAMRAGAMAGRLRGVGQILMLGLVLAAWAAVSGCSKSSDNPSGGPGTSAATRPADLRILAGSELKELEPDIKQAARDAGLTVEVSYSGTLEMVDRINAAEPFDAILPPNGAYPVLALAHKPLAREKLFYSRVALGIKSSKARALGWDRRAPTWMEVVRAVKDHKLVYGMTNPTSSNTGMSALFAVASSIAKKTEDLTAEEVDREKLKDFLSGQKLTAGSSGWLADAYARDEAHLDGLVNYEAVLFRLNEQAGLHEPLTVIYPQDGVISADYPLMLLVEAKRQAYERLVAALRSDTFQAGPVARMYLRPSNPNVARSPKLPGDAVAELSFPNRLEVIDAVLGAYQSELRRPATSIYLLDVSGSMRGKRIEQVKSALEVLTGAEVNSVTARFVRFQRRERVVLVPFSSTPGEPARFSFEDAKSESDSYQALRNYAEALQAHGGTAIYSALQTAYILAQQELARDPERVVTVVLLTDGENTQGIPYEDFRARFQEESASRNQMMVRTFPILFGEASSSELDEVARLTGGRSFDGRHANLANVFKEIRGYQ
jgi:Ca-activated chloride channel family protein